MGKQKKIDEMFKKINEMRKEEKEEYAKNCLESKLVHTEAELKEAISNYYGEIVAEGEFVKKIYENIKKYPKMKRLPDVFSIKGILLWPRLLAGITLTASDLQNYVIKSYSCDKLILDIRFVVYSELSTL